MHASQTYCGYIALIGQPNVGKSTLLNALLGKKLSITSRKPQTTRHRILGVKTVENAQFIFVDTPGLHEDNPKLLNQYLNRTALSVLNDVDIIVWVIDALKASDEDRLFAEKLTKIDKPLLIALNKTDAVSDKEMILSQMAEIALKIPQAECVPISAKKSANLDRLEQIIRAKLPESPFFFEPEMLTDRPRTFICAENIREQLVRLLGKELPYTTAVAIQSISENQKHISAIIWVEKESQKKIVIGEKGQMIKTIGQRARLSLEKYFNQKIFLTLWVKVKSNWTENDTILREMFK